MVHLFRVVAEVVNDRILIIPDIKEIVEAHNFPNVIVVEVNEMSILSVIQDRFEGKCDHSRSCVRENVSPYMGIGKGHVARNGSDNRITPIGSVIGKLGRYHVPNSEVVGSEGCCGHNAACPNLVGDVDASVSGISGEVVRGAKAEPCNRIIGGVAGADKISNLETCTTPSAVERNPVAA